MGRRSVISQLPPEVKEWLDQELIRRGFSGYRELAELLAQRGCQISHAAVHAYGQAFEQKCAAVKLASDQAKAIAEAVHDDGAMAQALTRLAQNAAFEWLVNFQLQDPEKITLPAMGRMIADLNRADIALQKFREEARAKAQKAADEVEKVMRKGGATEDQMAFMRQQMLEIVS